MMETKKISISEIMLNMFIKIKQKIVTKFKNDGCFFIVFFFKMSLQINIQVDRYAKCIYLGFTIYSYVNQFFTQKC